MHDLRSELGTRSEADHPRGGRRAGRQLPFKRDRVVDAAMRRFAELGYEGTRVHDVASDVGIAKGSVFQYFGSKEGLFVEAYKQAVRAFPRYLEAPEDIREEGFFATLRYWLERTEQLVRDDWIPYRVALLGDHGTDLAVKREINRFLTDEDPYGTVEFVRLGIERDEVREDIDTEMIVAMVDWLVDRFQDALVTEELDPGLFRRHGDPSARREARIEQFLELLQSAIGAGGRTEERRSTRPGSRPPGSSSR